MSTENKNSNKIFSTYFELFDNQSVSSSTVASSYANDLVRQHENFKKHLVLDGVENPNFNQNHLRVQNQDFIIPNFINSKIRLYLTINYQLRTFPFHQLRKPDRQFFQSTRTFREILT